MTVHVVLWLWKGWRPVYTWRHVNAMVRMVRYHLPGARILCLSDQPQTVWHPAECEVFPLWSSNVKLEAHDLPNCYRRLKIFDRGTQGMLGIRPGDIVWSKDLDSLVAGPLAPLLDPMTAGGHDPGGLFSHDFAAMGGLAARIHGSSFAFRAGTHEYLWREFDPVSGPREVRLPMLDGTARPIGSDQAWMSRKVSGEHLWQMSDGVYSWNRHGIIMSPARSANAVYWSFAGPNKPWGSYVRQTRPDLHQAYMAAYGEP